MPDVAAELQALGVSGPIAGVLAQYAEVVELPASAVEREALFDQGGRFGAAGKLWSIRPGNLLINWKMALLSGPGLLAAVVAGGPLAVTLGLLAALVPLAQGAAVELGEKHAAVARALWSDDTLNEAQPIAEAALARRLGMGEPELASVLTGLAQLGIVTLNDGTVIRRDQLMLEG